MSIGSNHMFSPLTKTSKAIDGQRLVRLIAKGKEKHENLSESLCVSVPVTGLEEVMSHIDVLAPYVVGMVHDTQDKLIREYRITHGHESINEAEFDIAHVVHWLTDNATGERLTAAALKEWFAADYGEVCREWLASLKSSEGLSADALNHKYNVFESMIVAYADVRHKPAKPQLNAVLNFAGAVEVDGRLSHIASKAQRMLGELIRAETEAETMFD